MLYSFPFEVGSMFGRAIMDETITRSDFLQDPGVWVSLGGQRFSRHEMGVFWGIIEDQRIRLQAARLVVAGECVALYPAMELVRRSRGSVPAGSMPHYDLAADR